MELRSADGRVHDHLAEQRRRELHDGRGRRLDQRPQQPRHGPARHAPALSGTAANACRPRWRRSRYQSSARHRAVRLKVTGSPPWALNTTPVKFPSGFNSPWKLQGSMFGNVKLTVLSLILKLRNGLSILPKFVPISLPLTVPSLFFVNWISMSSSIVTMRGRPTHVPANASATPGPTVTGGCGGSALGCARS